MENRPNVVIVMARCGHSKKYFGIRFEENQSMERYPKHNFGGESGQFWAADWAFEIRRESGGREGYDKTEISGIFSISRNLSGLSVLSWEIDL